MGNAFDVEKSKVNTTLESAWVCMSVVCIFLTVMTSITSTKVSYIHQPVFRRYGHVHMIPVDVPLVPVISGEVRSKSRYWKRRKYFSSRIQKSYNMSAKAKTWTVYLYRPTIIHNAIKYRHYINCYT